MLGSIVTAPSANQEVSWSSGQQTSPCGKDITLFRALLNKETTSEMKETGLESGTEDSELQTFLGTLLSLSDGDWKELLSEESFEQLKADIANWHKTVQSENLSVEDALLSLFTHLGLITEPINHYGGKMNGIENLQQFLTQFTHSIIANQQTGEQFNQKLPSSNQLASKLYLLLSGQSEVATQRQSFQDVQQPSRVTAGGKLGMENEMILRPNRQENEQGKSIQHEQKNIKFPLQYTSFFRSGPMDQVQQLELHTQLKNNAGEPALAKQFESIFASSRLQTFRNGATTLHVKLYPEHLGSLAIKLIHVNGDLIARITAETVSAKQLIESQLHQLRHAFSSQNINIEKIEVLQSGQQTLPYNQQNAKGEERENGNKSGYQAQEDERDEYENSEEENSFQAWLNTLTI